MDDLRWTTEKPTKPGMRCPKCTGLLYHDKSIYELESAVACINCGGRWLEPEITQTHAEKMEFWEGSFEYKRSPKRKRGRT